MHITATLYSTLNYAILICDSNVQHCHLQLSDAYTSFRLNQLNGVIDMVGTVNNAETCSEHCWLFKG